MWSRVHPDSSKSLCSTPEFLRIYLPHYDINSIISELICQNALVFNSYTLIL